MKKALLVDDDYLVRSYLKMLPSWEKADFVIAADVRDGEEALELMEEKGEPDVLITDIQMPVMDGYDATARIRRMKDEEKASIPIIAMTANAFAEDRQKAISVGMNDHVAKPIDMNVLLPVIAKYIR